TAAQVAGEATSVTSRHCDRHELPGPNHRRERRRRNQRQRDGRIKLDDIKLITLGGVCRSVLIHFRSGIPICGWIKFRGRRSLPTVGDRYGPETGGGIGSHRQRFRLSLDTLRVQPEYVCEICREERAAEFTVAIDRYGDAILSGMVRSLRQILAV